MNQQTNKPFIQLQRFQEQEINRRKHIEKEQENIFKSREIIQKSPNRKPQIDKLYQRQIDEQKQKFKWIEQQQQLLNHKRYLQEMQDVTFHPTILQQSKLLNHGRTRTPEQYYSDALKYKDYKDKQLQQIKQLLEENLKEKYPFTPQVNEKSTKMVQQSFYDRLEEKQALKEYKLKQIQKKTLPTFNPQLTTSKVKKRAHTPKAMPISFQNQNKFDYSPKQVKDDQKVFDVFEEARKRNYVSDQKHLLEEDIKKKLILINQYMNKEKNKVLTEQKLQQRSISPIRTNNQIISSPYKSILKTDIGTEKKQIQKKKELSNTQITYFNSVYHHNEDSC